MQASQPLRPPSSRTDGHLGAIGLLIVAALLVAIVKPWGSGSVGAVTLDTPPPSAAPTLSPAPTRAGQIGFSGLAYDKSIFGNHEPQAVWEIWPAGFLVTFGFVIQVPDASASPAPSSGPRATPRLPAGSLDGPGPAWPNRLDLPDGDHLLLIGIDMPQGYQVVASHLVRYSTDSADVPVDLARFASPWPSHFAVLGIPTTPGQDLLNVWPPGQYRLDLTFNPGGLTRTVDIQITSPLPGL
jgi:hypothetical protein